MLFFAFILDSVSAIADTKKQRGNNVQLIYTIKDSGGVVALDQPHPSHRMAYAPVFPKWTWEPLAEMFGLDSVHVYPHYCQDKWYGNTPPFENAYVEDSVAEDDIFGKYACLTIRVKEKDLREKGNHVSFSISYSRPHKWYKAWLDRWRNYQYDRIDVVERDFPDALFDGFGYYVIYMKKENLNNLKGIITDLS